ncbi:MAG: hydroxysqualene dehydroxylase HpnE [Sideroxydans sp.]
MAEELKVGIVGGGYAGMAAAVELAAHGIPVTVFESARQLGGRARGVPHNGTQLDNGQHLLLGCYRETLRLIELVGGDIGQDFLRLPLQLDLHGQFSLKAPYLPAPLHLLVALLKAQGLTWNERVKAARFMLTLRRMGFRLPCDMTVAELLAQHEQDADLTLKLWEPLCIAALNTPVHKASAQVLLNVLRDALNRTRADSDMLLPRLDFTDLFPQRAAAYVERHGGKVHLSCGIEAIVEKDGGIELVTTQGTRAFSHVICAAPPTVAGRLLRSISTLESTVAQIDSLQHQPIYTVYVQYAAHVRLPHPMIGLRQHFSQWLFDKGRIAGHHGLIAAVISAEGAHQELSQEELAHEVIAELREEFGIDENPEWFKVIAEKRATFCCAPKLQRPPQQTSLPRLLLAGDYTAGDYPATLEGAVQSGLRCAELLMRS